MANELHNETKTMALRKFGIIEMYQLATYLLDQYRGTILSCRYAIPLRLTPAESRTRLEQAVEIAVVEMIMRHPMLQVGIKDATNKIPSWVQLPSVDLTQHIKWLHIGGTADFEQTVQETFRSQLDERFPDISIEQPGWKFTMIRQENAPIMEVLLTWNHPQFDGAGARVLHEDFLEMLNNAENGICERTGLDGSILTLPQAPPLLPIPIETLQKLPLDFKFFAKAFWEDIRPQFLNRDVSQAFWCPIRSSPYKTQFRSFFIDIESLLAILALCRKNKTTITGLLNGLALIAFSLRLESTAAPAFQSSTIMDHRRHVPPAPPDAPWVRSDRAVTNYVTQLPHKYDTNLVARIRSKLPADANKEMDLSTDLQRELWAVSAQSRLEIARKLEAGLRNDLIGIFKHVKDWHQIMRDLANKPRRFTWLVTNVGVLDGKKSNDDQKWSIERAQFGVSADIPAAAIAFSPISVAGRGMCVSADWTDCAVDVKFGERIMGDLKRWLTQLANQS
ncbi:putative alcohol acetyltransferase FCK4 [Lachnellula suecica]|uniref:Putative alcohol acetyltransferase FCK4 n=1 Tax=Lachnellula suecica TaxID=602035 RepID=A0A8T9CEB0_9HELO|nr:putative alcohol acetyltransferase FCK4 [Lachnellula suecica]